MNKAFERLYNGIIKENPTLVLLLGMCPTMAVTTKAVNGLGMGLTTMAVLALSNLIISLLRKVIPDRVRIPAFIVIIASFVTVLQLLLQAYIPWLYTALGVYIPLIVVNCIILGRAESYAYKNPPVPSLFDGLGMGLGFTLSLTVIGALREILGSGTLFDQKILPAGYVPIRIFGLAPGAFFVMALLCTIQNLVREKLKSEGKTVRDQRDGCTKDCLSCSDTGCGVRLYDNKNPGEKKADKKTNNMPVEPVKPEVKKEIDLKKMTEKVRVSGEAIRQKVFSEIEKEDLEKLPVMEESVPTHNAGAEPGGEKAEISGSEGEKNKGAESQSERTEGAKLKGAETQSSGEEAKTRTGAELGNAGSDGKDLKETDTEEKGSDNKDKGSDGKETDRKPGGNEDGKR